MTYPKETIVEFAKELYLMLNDQGNHRYSLQGICAEIQRRFNKSLSRSTIAKWAKKYGWWTLWQNAVRKGITSAIKNEYDNKRQKDKELDKKYEELIAKKKRDDFLRATQLKILGFKYIQENGFPTASDALRALEIGMKYTEDLIVELNIKSDEAKRIEEATESLKRAIEFSNRNSNKK